MSRVRVFIACSLDGFIAGPDDDLSWLPQGQEPDGPKTDALGYDGFIAQVGAILMGRRSYDVVSGFDIPWPYGAMPVLVVSNRDLQSPPDGVRRAKGATLAAMIEDARSTAGTKDVYLDGGNLIRQALDAGLVDELIVTVVPTILGEGVPLFAGTLKRHPLELLAAHPAGQGMVELRYRPAGTNS